MSALTTASKLDGLEKLAELTNKDRNRHRRLLEDLAKRPIKGIIGTEAICRRIAREQRLLSGADCGWTQLQKSSHWYCRTNGRTYRASPNKDKMWNLYRVNSTSDDEQGNLIGKYRGRGDATKVITQMAYQPEPKW